MEMSVSKNWPNLVKNSSANMFAFLNSCNRLNLIFFKVIANSFIKSQYRVLPQKINLRFIRIRCRDIMAQSRNNITFGYP